MHKWHNALKSCINKRCFRSWNWALSRDFLSLGFPTKYDSNHCQPGPEVMQLFSCSAQLSTEFILLINVEMPTIVGILTFISMINTTSERPKARNFFICRYFSFYVLSWVEPEESFITSGPALLHRLARILKFCMKEVQILYFPISELQRCRPDCAHAQAGLHLCCSHVTKSGFHVTRSK